MQLRLQAEINIFTFLRGLHDAAANHDAAWAWSTSRDVIDLLLFFYMFWLINKCTLLFSVILLFNYVDFMRYGT